MNGIEAEVELFINFQLLTAARAAAALAAAIFLAIAPAISFGTLAKASFVFTTAAFALRRPNGFGAACDSWR